MNPNYLVITALNRVKKTVETFFTFLSFRYPRWICFAIILLAFSLALSQAIAEEEVTSSGAPCRGHILYVATPGM